MMSTFDRVRDLVGHTRFRAKNRLSNGIRHHISVSLVKCTVNRSPHRREVADWLEYSQTRTTVHAEPAEFGANGNCRETTA